MKIAVTGANGQLGSELCRQLGERAIPLHRGRLDLTRRDEIRDAVSQLKPDAVVNCAAYTAVDRAEQEPELCYAVNAEAVALLAEACAAAACPLLQVSSDYVFGGNGDRRTPYLETDAPAPQGVYACSKLAGEQEAARLDRHFVVRTCGLYAKSSRNFVETMLKLGVERGPLRVVNDQHCTPSSVVDIAKAILFLLGTSAYGTYHVVNAGATTWFEFAGEIFRQAELDVVLEPITTEQFGAPAYRPRFSVLDTGKYHGLGGPQMPSWRDARATYLSQR